MMVIVPVSIPTPKLPNDNDDVIQVTAYPLLQRHWNHHGLRRMLVTKTVPGFMDFVTTVGNTVMVFTPQAGIQPTRLPMQQQQQQPAVPGS